MQGPKWNNRNKEEITVIKNRECLGNWSCSRWNEINDFFTALGYIDSASDIADIIVNFGRPAYKHLKGPISLGGPLFEGILGAGSQLVSDAQYPHLTPAQRGLRAMVIGVEDMHTDFLSELYGYGIGAPIGAFAGGEKVIVETAGIGAPVTSP